MPSVIDEISLPHIPLKVNLEDLESNNKLLTDHQIIQAIKNIEDIKKTSHKILNRETFAKRFKKTELNMGYDIIAFDKNYFAVYYGAGRGKHLGAGGFGYVKLVQNLNTGEWAVLKLTAVDNKRNEYLLLQKVDLALGYLERMLPTHKPNSFVNYQLKKNRRDAITSSPPRQANLLMKLADGIDLDELAQGNYNLPVSKWIEIILQVSKDYKKLKDKNIIHKDLKPKNIFYSLEKNKATIIDLGGSRKKSLFVTKKLEKEIYTQGYIAPELFLKTHYNEATDIYALGKTFLHLLNLNSSSLSHIKDAQLYFKLYRYCYYRMANKLAKDRPSIEQVIQFLETLEHACFNLLPKSFRKIALFSVDEFLHYRQDTENEISIKESPKKAEYAFISALKLFDEVWFIDTSKREQKEYIQLRRELKAKNIIVGQRCFLTEDNITQAIPAVLEKIGEANLTKGNKYFFITAQAAVKELKGICPITLQPEQDEDYYQKIIEVYTQLDIEKEYQTIRESLSSLASQYDIVKNTLEKFDKLFSEGKLSIDCLKDNLRQLKKQLPAFEDNKVPKSSHYNSTFFSKFGHHQSQSIQCIKQINTQIDDWVSSYQM